MPALAAVVVSVLLAPGSASAVESIDAYRFDDTGTSCSQAARPGAAALLQWLIDHDAVGASGGIYACRTIAGTDRLSLHAEGRAVDWVLDNRDARQRKIADRIVEALLKRRHGHDHALARRMGIQEIIWNCRIWRSDRPHDGRAPYPPCSTSADRTVRHENHVHLGLNHEGAARQTGFWTGGPWPPDLLALKSSATRTHAQLLDGGTAYTSALRQRTLLGRTPRGALGFAYGDYDHDSVDDLFAIEYRGPRRAHVVVYSGATHFGSRLLVASTALAPRAASGYAFALGDHDHDGRLDLYAIEYRERRSTRVHVLSGANAYRSVLRSTATPLPKTSARMFQFAIGDRNNDGFDDVYAIRRRGATTTVYILDGAAGYGSLEGPLESSILKTAAGRVQFLVGDGNGDGDDDIYGITHRAGSATAQVQSLAGPLFDSSSLRARIALRPTGKGVWAFALPAQSGR